MEPGHRAPVDRGGGARCCPSSCLSPVSDETMIARASRSRYRAACQVLPTKKQMDLHFVIGFRARRADLQIRAPYELARNAAGFDQVVAAGSENRNSAPPSGWFDAVMWPP